MKISQIHRAVGVVGSRFMLCVLAAERAKRLAAQGVPRASSAAVVEIAAGRLPSGRMHLLPEPPLPDPGTARRCAEMLFEMEVEVQPTFDSVVLIGRTALVRVRVSVVDFGKGGPPRHRVTIPFDFVLSGPATLTWRDEPWARILFTPRASEPVSPWLNFLFEVQSDGTEAVTVACYSRRQTLCTANVLFTGTSHHEYRDSDDEPEIGFGTEQTRPLPTSSFEH